MNKIWFTSDTHFGHGNMIKYSNRPFLGEVDQVALDENGGTWESLDEALKEKDGSRWRMSREAVEMMDNAIIDGINTNVGTDDQLWLLGDFAMPGKKEYTKKCREYRDRINCQHINIVWGNHDRRNDIRDLFDEAYDLVTIKASGQKARIVLAHYAMATWDQSHRGAWNLYGHSHTTAEKWMDKHMPDRKSVDIGVDNAYQLLGEFRPFELEQDLRPMLMGRLGHSMRMAT